MYIRAFAFSVLSLLATSTIASQAPQHKDTSESVDCAASHRFIRRNIWRRTPPGVTPEQFEYCHLVPAPDSLVSTRLTVQPHAMVIGTQNLAAGVYPLDSIPGYVYIPPKCVGAQRCPLVVFLQAGGIDARADTMAWRWQLPVANTYGTIILAAKATRSSFDTDQELENRHYLDAALHQALRKFAIDPDRIALAGWGNGSWYAMIWGGDNLAIFSRVIVFPPGAVTIGGVDAPNGTTQFYIDNYFASFSSKDYQIAHELEARGFYVKHTLSPPEKFSQEPANLDWAWRWLQESWAKPNPQDRTQPRVVDTLPELTLDAANAVSKFWTAFEQLPDSIRTVATRAHQQEIAVPVGDANPSMIITNMSALARQYSVVGNAFKAAGITPEQYDADRIALLSAFAAYNNAAQATTISPNSVQAKNLAFVTTYQKELEKLKIGEYWPTMGQPIWHTL